MNNKSIYPTYFVLLPFLIFLFFYLLPSILGLGYAFTDYNALSDKVNFVGLQNFFDISGDPNFRIALKNTLTFTVFTTFVQNILGLLLAMLLNLEIRTRNILRVVNFLPVVLSMLVVGLMFTSVFKPETGIFDKMLVSVGLGSLQKDWLGDPSSAMWMVNIVNIWKTVGFCMVVYLAGLQIVPKWYYEAADIDGAGKLQKLVKITLPMIVPAISTNVVLSVLWALGVFDVVVSVTGGGPGSSTEVLGTIVYQHFGRGNYAYATTIGLVLFAFITVVTVLLNNVFRKLEVDK